jgi:acyl-CoA thioesterase FadM
MRGFLFLLTLAATIASLVMESPMKNTWQQRYGASRRKIDHAILAEMERKLEAEERLVVTAVKLDTADVLSFEDEERKRIARAFGRPVK